jgi:alkylation response protein AidB-like acyl-CoA dehydrogenase
MGREGEGWQVAMATLMFERGNVGGQAGGLSMMDINVNDVLELARRSKRNGKPALEDPLIRDQMVQFLIEAKSNALMGSKTKIPALNTERPTAIAMSGKLRGSELKRRFCQFAISLQGANGGRFISPEAVDGGKWQRIYFNSFSATIGGGTTQVQYNIMGERVLGLPKS